MFFAYRDYIKGTSKYNTMIETMKQEVEEFGAQFQDDPRFISGWGHGFFCNEDGGRLIYDRTSPLNHKCSICGRVYSDYIYASYFTTMYRNEAIVTAMKASFLYQIDGEEQYLELTRRIIGFYADNYQHFAVHAKSVINCDPTIDVGGAGKIMPQGLNEAMMAIRFITALEMVRDKLEPEWIDSVKTKLFDPIVELLLPQKMHIHNIPIWINSAIGMIGLFFGEKEWTDEATVKPFNIYEQLDNGLTESGFWYEGSIHYNFFALEGLVTFLAFAKAYEFVIPEKYLQNVNKMLHAAYFYAFDNDRFPNPSDGWPNISLKTYSYVYFMAYKVFGEELLPLINHIQKNPLERGRLPLSEPYYFENQIPLEQLIYAADYEEKSYEEAPKRGSNNFEGSNCATLRNEYFNVFLKYGHQTKSHAHPDKMNIEIMVGNQVLTKDLSNSGYASRMCNEWHRKIAAHNTCAVNGQPTDILSAGTTLHYNEHLIEATAPAYDGVTYTRRLQLEGEKILDTFTVSGAQEGVIDWFFHFETPVDRSGLRLSKVSLFEEYGYIMEAYEIKPELITVELVNELVKLKIVLEDRAKIYLAKTYNNPADKLRDTVIVRKTGSNAVFTDTITVL